MSLRRSIVDQDWEIPQEGSSTGLRKSPSLTGLSSLTSASSSSVEAPPSPATPSHPASRHSRSASVGWGSSRRPASLSKGSLKRAMKKRMSAKDSLTAVDGEILNGSSRITELSSIAAHLLTQGLVVRDRRRRRCVQCFVGKEFVDTVQKAFPSVARADAVELGQEMQRCGMLVHAIRAGGAFRDSPTDLYRFVSQPLSAELLKLTRLVREQCHVLRMARSQDPLVNSALVELEKAVHIELSGHNDSFHQLLHVLELNEKAVEDMRKTRLSLSLIYLQLENEQMEKGTLSLHGEEFIVTEHGDLERVRFRLSDVTVQPVEGDMFDFVDTQQGSFFRVQPKRPSAFAASLSSHVQKVIDARLVTLAHYVMDELVPASMFQPAVPPGVRQSMMRLWVSSNSHVGAIRDIAASTLRNVRGPDDPAFSLEGALGASLVEMCRCTCDKLLQGTVFHLLATPAGERPPHQVAAQELLDNIGKDALLVPHATRYAFHIVDSKMFKLFSRSAQGFLMRVFFLGFICDALVNPDDYGMRGRHTPVESDTLYFSQVSLQLQSIARGSNMTKIVARNQKLLDSLFETLTTSAQQNLAYASSFAHRTLCSDAILVYSHFSDHRDSDMFPPFPTFQHGLDVKSSVMVGNGAGYKGGSKSDSSAESSNIYSSRANYLLDLESVHRAVQDGSLPSDEMTIKFSDWCKFVGGNESEALEHFLVMEGERMISGVQREGSLILSFQLSDSSFQQNFGDPEWLRAFLWPFICTFDYEFLRHLCQASLKLGDSDLVDVVIRLLPPIERYGFLTVCIEQRVQNTDEPEELWDEKGFDSAMISELVCSSIDREYFASLVDMALEAWAEEADITVVLSIILSNIESTPPLPLMTHKLLSFVFHVCELYFAGYGSMAMSDLFLRIMLLPFIQRNCSRDADLICAALDAMANETELDTDDLSLLTFVEANMDRMEMAVSAAMAAPSDGLVDDYDEDDMIEQGTCLYLLSCRLTTAADAITAALGLPPLHDNSLSLKKALLLSLGNAAREATLYRFLFRVRWEPMVSEDALITSLSADELPTDVLSNQNVKWHQPNVIPRSLKEARADIVSNEHKSAAYSTLSRKLLELCILVDDVMLHAFLNCCGYDARKAASLAAKYHSYYGHLKMSRMPIEFVETAIRAHVAYADPRMMRDLKGRALLIMRMNKNRPDLGQGIVHSVMYFAQRLAEDISVQYQGVCCLLDLQGFGWGDYQHSLVRPFFRAWQGLPVRIEKILIVDGAKWFGRVVKSIRHLIPVDHRRGMINVKRADLFQYVDPSCLPSFLGGMLEINLDLYVEERKRTESSAPPADTGAFSYKSSATLEELNDFSENKEEGNDEFSSEDLTQDADPKRRPKILSAAELRVQLQGVKTSNCPSILDVLGYLVKHARKATPHDVDISHFTRWITSKFPECSPPQLFQFLEEEALMFRSSDGRKGYTHESSSDFVKSARGMNYVRELLCRDNFLLLRHVADVAAANREVDFYTALAQMLAPAEYVSFAKVCLHDEFSLKTNATPMLSQFMREWFSTRLRSIFHGLQSIIERPASFELDITRMDDSLEDGVTAAVSRVAEVSRLLVDALRFSLPETSNVIKALSYSVREEYETRFPGEGLRAVGTLMVHEVLTPLILNPIDHSGMHLILTDDQKRALTVITLVLQSAIPGARKIHDPLYQCLSPVVQQISASLQSWLKDVSAAEPRLSSNGALSSHRSFSRMKVLLDCAQDMRQHIHVGEHRKGLKVFSGSFRVAACVDYIMSRFQYSDRGLAVSTIRELSRYRLVYRVDGESRIDDGPELMQFGEMDMTANELFQRFGSSGSRVTKNQRAKSVRPLFRRLISYSDSLVDRMRFPLFSDSANNGRLCVLTNRTHEAQCYRTLLRWHPYYQRGEALRTHGSPELSDESETISVASDSHSDSRKTSSEVDAIVQASVFQRSPLTSGQELLVRKLSSDLRMDPALVEGAMRNCNFDQDEYEGLLRGLDDHRASLLSDGVLDCLMNAVLQRSGLNLLLSMDKIGSVPPASLRECFWYHVVCMLAEEMALGALGVTLIIDPKEHIDVPETFFVNLNGWLDALPISVTKIVIIEPIGKKWALAKKMLHMFQVDEVLRSESLWKPCPQTLTQYMSSQEPPEEKPRDWLSRTSSGERSLRSILSQLGKASPLLRRSEMEGEKEEEEYERN